jgi:hypothetical protein
MGIEDTWDPLERQGDLIEAAYDRTGTLYVPENKTLKFFFGIVLILAGVTLLIGISAISTIFALIQSSITNFLSSLIGWDPLISTILVGVLCLFFATLIYVIGRRGSDIVQRVERILRMNVTNEPTEYYALGIVPEEELLYEFKKRGCKVSSGGAGRGVSIDCPRMPVTKRVASVTDPSKVTLSLVQKVTVVVVMAVIWGIYGGSALHGAITDDMLWITAMALLGLTSIVLMGSRVVKFWHTILLWLAVNIVFTFFVTAEEMVVWSLWGVLGIYTVLVCIAYLLHGRGCKEKWYCEVI